MFVPFQCTLFRNPSAGSFTSSIGLFELIDRHSYSARLARMLFGSTESRQRFCYETDDWAICEGAMDSTFVPLRNTEDIQRLTSLKLPIDLLYVTPQPQDDRSPGNPGTEPRRIGLPGEVG